MDMTVIPGFHKLSLRATIDLLCMLTIILPLSTVAKKPFYCNAAIEFEMIDTKNSSTAIVEIYELIT